MARPPVTANEEFLREVEDQVRLDIAKSFWNRWGKLVIALSVAAILALGGWLYWSSERAKAAAADGEKLALALDDLTNNRPMKAEGELKTLTDAQAPGYRAASQLALAASLLAKNDTKGAIALYDKVAADTSLGQPFRDAATVRGVAAGFDTMTPDQVVAKLKPLAVAGNPWFGSAGEMTAIAHMKAGRNREAGQLFAALAKDEGVPESIRSRSVQLAAVLGIEATPAKTSRN